MARHLKLVRGGGSGSLTCACTVVTKTIKYAQTYELYCACTKSKYFIALPERWVCDDCSRGKHVTNS